MEEEEEEEEREEGRMTKKPEKSVWRNPTCRTATLTT